MKLLSLPEYAPSLDTTRIVIHAVKRVAMPPAAIRDLRDTMYWQYAKIIADSAGVGKWPWAFVMDRFKKLQSGEIAWDSIHEYVKEHNDVHRCLYRGRAGDLTMGSHPA